MKKLLLSVVIVMASTLSMPVFSKTAPVESTLTTAEAESFVEQTGNEIIRVLVSKTTPMVERKKQFRSILQTRFSLPSIAKFVLARYWRQATDPQKERYLKLFEDATVENYAAQFDNYSNEKLSILDSRASKANAILVASQVIRPSGAEPLRVDWRVSKSRVGELKIVDLIINGVSMSITQRSEYASMVQSAGGNLDNFLQNLESDLKSPQKKT